MDVTNPAANSSPSSSSVHSESSKSSASQPSFLGGTSSATHLVVLVHGLWGQPQHMHSIARSLRAQYPADDLYLHCAADNSGMRTYDGVEHGGERVCAEIEALLAHKAKNDACGFRKISMIGYSLGGLLARYAIGLLEAKGVLNMLECMVSLWTQTFNPRNTINPC